MRQPSLAFRPSFCRGVRGGSSTRFADHFGENASLGEAQRKAVLDYLLANAADGPQSGRQGRKFAEGISASQAPLRITETPRWVREHRKVRADRWRDPQIKSRANCVACHPAAEQGLYDD
jgi:hypothetical protein